MSLRSLIYLLARRLYPRNIFRAQAESSPGIVSQAASVLSAAGASDRAYGAAVAAALAAGAGILVFKKHPDNTDRNVTDEDTVRTRKPEVMTDYSKPMQLDNWDVDMEARFYEWMRWMGRVYPNPEEFEIFKEKVKTMDSLYVGESSAPRLPNLFADRTHEEIQVMTGRSRRVPSDQDDEEYEAECRMIKEKMKRNIDNCSKH
ncbi:unnamed protein product [Urochloa decumbens]|uniref:Uncharacterized protein n=1 Tax=Urochloa decumbens TaxID=240449 RepID=A0ABC8Y3N0_9POAL